MSTRLTAIAWHLVGKLGHLLNRTQAGLRPARDPAFSGAPGPAQGKPGQRACSAAMKPRLMQIVRRAIDQDVDTLVVTRRVHAAARRLAGPSWRSRTVDRESLIRLIAQDLLGTYFANDR